MRNGFRVAACAAVLALAAAACGGDDEDSSSSTTAAGGATTTAQASGDCADEAFLCIGLVTDVGNVDDKSFNESAWNGATQAASELGGRADYIETKDSKDYGTNIKSFVDKRYDVIVTVGFAIGEATTEAAKTNTGITFIGVDQFQADPPLPNLTGLVFNEDKAGFMAGALAGLLTKSNTVAAVLGTDKVPPVVAFKTGWENGAKHTNPNVKLLSTYHPGGLDKAFLDPEWGAQTAKQALDNGADVVFGAGGKTGNGALEEVAKKSGAYCVGVDTDQWETVPAARPCLVTSAMKLITPGVIELIKQAKDGSLKSGNFFGEADLAPFHDFDAKIPADVKDKVAKIVEDVRSGAIPTGYNPGG